MNSSKIVLYTNLIALSKKELTTYNKSSLDLDQNKLFSRHNNVMTVHVDIQYKRNNKNREGVTKQSKLLVAKIVHFKIFFKAKTLFFKYPLHFLYIIIKLVVVFN